jgi:thymidylate synthase ThyX
MTRNFTKLHLLTEMMNKQLVLRAKLAKLQGELLILTSRLMFTADKQQRKTINESISKIKREIRSTTRAFKKAHAACNRLSKKI